MHDIAEFLSTRDPFVALEPDGARAPGGRVRRSSTSRPGRRSSVRARGRPTRCGWCAPARVELLDERAGARPARRGRAVRPPVDALRAADRLGGARRARARSATGWRPTTCIPLLADPAGLRSVARSLMDRPRPASAPASERGRSRRSASRRRAALIRRAPGGLRARAVAARGRRADEDEEAQLDPRRPRRRRARDRHRSRPALAAWSRPGSRRTTPLGEVMSAPASPLGAEQTSAELMLTMLDRGHPPRAGRLGAVASCSAWSPTSTCSPPRREPRSCCGGRSPTPPTLAALRAGSCGSSTRRVVALHAAGVAATQDQRDPLGRSSTRWSAG